jgi:3-hydroxyacyl-CoA dehydrogenase
MPVTAIDHVTVIGAGNMGHGIAEITAIAGYDVTLRDIEEVTALARRARVSQPHDND